MHSEKSKSILRAKKDNFVWLMRRWRLRRYMRFKTW